MPHGEPVDKSLQENWNRKTGYPQDLDKPIVGGRVGGGEGSVQAEGAGLWTVSGFPGKPNWSIQTKKSRVWVCFAGFSSEGYTVGKALGRQIVYHCDSAGVSRACSQEVSVSSKPLQATCHTKGAKASMLWSSARLSRAAFIKKQFRPSGKNGGRPWPSGCTLMGSPRLSPHD